MVIDIALLLRRVVIALTLLFANLACGATQMVAITTADGLSLSTSSTQAENVQLPYDWDKQHPGERGLATFIFRIRAEESLTSPRGIYFPKIGNAYEIWLNDSLVQRRGNLQAFDGSDYAKRPRFLSLPAEFLKTENEVRVIIRADRYRRAGLSTFYYGPEEEVLAQYEKDNFAMESASLVTWVISGLMCILSFMLWATQSRSSGSETKGRYPIYFFAGLTDLFLFIRMADYFLASPPLPWPLWAFILSLSGACWVAGITMTAVFLARWNRIMTTPLLSGWFFFPIIVITVLQPQAIFQSPSALHFFDKALLNLYIAFFTVVYLAHAIRSNNKTLLLMGLILLTNTILGIRDYFVSQFVSSFEFFTLQQFSAILFEFALMYFVVQRFSVTSERLIGINTDLERRLREREAELREAHAQAEAHARAQERITERGRILKDMHDGVGAHISVAIQQLRSGQSRESDVLQTLRESLDHLKLSIDSLSIPAGDVTAMLANMRYRLRSRLQDGGLQLKWAVGKVDPVASLGDSEMRHLQFVVYGALANALQHAQATEVKVELGSVPNGVLLRIVDNGCGFDIDTAMAQSMGLRSMRDRMHSMGGKFSLQSGPKGTAVELLLQ